VKLWSPLGGVTHPAALGLFDDGDTTTARLQQDSGIRFKREICVCVCATAIRPSSITFHTWPKRLETLHSSPPGNTREPKGKGGTAL